MFFQVRNNTPAQGYPIKLGRDRTIWCYCHHLNFTNVQKLPMRSRFCCTVLYKHTLGVLPLNSWNVKKLTQTNHERQKASASPFWRAGLRGTRELGKVISSLHALRPMGGYWQSHECHKPLSILVQHFKSLLTLIFRKYSLQILISIMAFRGRISDA